MPCKPALACACHDEGNDCTPAMPVNDLHALLKDAPRFLFFTGKRA
jgi:hypothetical protein